MKTIINVAGKSYKRQEAEDPDPGQDLFKRLIQKLPGKTIEINSRGLIIIHSPMTGPELATMEAEINK